MSNYTVPAASAPATLSRFTRLFLMLTSFLNVMGFTIITPVLPFIVQRYLADPAALPGVVGWLTASYAICQFVAAPALGVLSDRFGRRPVLLICLAGSVAGYVLFGIGGALWSLFLGRIIDGLTGGNFSILGAYIADISAPEERGKLFGQMSAVGGIGFIVGPVLGGFAARLGYSAPLFLAAGITFLGFLLGLFAMPESLSHAQRSTTVRLNDLNPIAQLYRIMRIDRLRWLLITSLLYFFPFALFTTELGVLAVDYLNWAPESIGLLMLLVGITDIVMQGVLAGWLIKRMGEVAMTIVGFIVIAAAFVLIGMVAVIPQNWVALTGIVLWGLGSGLIEPALNGLISRTTQPQEQGAVQGGNTALRSVANIGGALLAGMLYLEFGGQAPYWLGAGLLLLGIGSILLATRNLPATPPGELVNAEA